MKPINKKFVQIDYDLGVSDEMCGLQALTRAAYDSLGIHIYLCL
jgi:hypothetical protein